MSSVRRSANSLFRKVFFPCGAARRCPGQTGPVRQSQGGDPAGVAGWGGGLYFDDPGGIKKFRRAVQRGKELPERGFNQLRLLAIHGAALTAPSVALVGFREQRNRKLG